MPSTESDILLLKYTHCRSIIEHENILLNHRMTWMWTLQGLLFTAASLFYKFLKDSFPVITICLVGLITCISISYCLYKSHKKLNTLHDEVKVISSNEEIINMIPNYNNSDNFFDFLYPWKFLPITFAFAWIALAYYFFIVPFSSKI